MKTNNLIYKKVAVLLRFRALSDWKTRKNQRIGQRLVSVGETGRGFPTTKF